MKLSLKISSCLLLLLGLFHLSCKKEYSCEGCINGNKPPIANAGPDQVITLPTDSVSLDGTTTSDPDGMISSLSSVNGLKGAFPDEYHLKNVIHRNGIRGLFT